jgi:hypothetical protein
MCKIVSRALVAALCVAVSVPALAHSKSAEEFTLTTCLVAMDDLAKVEGMARENNWTNKTLPIPPL